MPLSRSSGVVDKLTPKERRFIAEFLVDQNGRQAAIRAGYSERTAAEQASRLLKRSRIQRAVHAALKEIHAKCEVTAERVIAELGRLAFSDVRQLYNESGGLRPIHEWPEDAARAVAGIDTDELFQGVGRDRERVGETKKVRLWTKNHALETLARHFKLLTDKVEMDVSDNLAELMKAARNRKKNAK